MKSLKTLFTLTLTAFILVSFTSCSKDNSGDKARLQVYLTDQPGNYGEVNINVQEVLINYSNDTGKNWVALPGVQSKTYDLLKLTNGNEALLSDAEVETGRIQQIRLVLGDNNNVKVGTQTFALQTPSAQQSGLKVKINQDVNEGVSYKLLLDFDASRSIVRTGNGGYILKPVIRATVEAIGGGIKGFVTPTTFPTAVYAIKGAADTVAGTTTLNGAYQIKGIDAGTYSLTFAPSDVTYQKQTRAVTVTTGNVTVVDTVKLVK